MNAKMKECFTPHAMMHSLMGLGLGLILAALVPSIATILIGGVIVLVAIVLDMMRKN